MIVQSLIPALLGGCIGAYLQSWHQRKMITGELLWDFRIKLREAEQAMWKEKIYAEFQAPINWLRVAATDPRINIDISKIEDYAKALNAGWDNLWSEDNITFEKAGIRTTKLDLIEKIREEIDTLILNKIKHYN